MHPVRRLRMMLCYPFCVLAVVVSVNWLANPYDAWPLSLIDKIFQQGGPGKERLATPYRVRIEQPTTVLVGSSRILFGMQIEQGCRDGVLNAGLAGASVDEIVSLLRLARHSTRLKRVLWGVDFYPFQENYRGYHDGPTGARLEGDPAMLVRDTLLSTKALSDSWELVRAAVRGRAKLPATALLPIPWPENVIRDSLQQLADGPSPALDEPKFTRDLPSWFPLYTDYKLAPTQVDLLRNTVAQLQAAGIEVILLVPPLNGYELEVIRQTGRWQLFQDWKRTLASIAPYWDYSGYNQLARTDWLYTPNCFCHFQPVVGNIIYRQVLGQGCEQCGDAADIVLNAGVRVDANSVQQHLDQEDALLRASVETNARYARSIKQLLNR
jgi:hypothetical protein